MGWSAAVGLIDNYATLLFWCGGERPLGCPGLVVDATFLSKTKEQRKRERELIQLN